MELVTVSHNDVNAKAYARDKVVNEPSQRDGDEVDPVTPNDKQIWDSSVAHRILFVM